jgi:hypothetical protein
VNPVLDEQQGSITEWFQFLDWTDLDAPQASGRDLGSEAKCLISVACFNDNEAAELLFRLSEWSIGED